LVCVCGTAGAEVGLGKGCFDLDGGVVVVVHKRRVIWDKLWAAGSQMVGPEGRGWGVSPWTIFEFNIDVAGDTLQILN
jgi:hypothetical protein